MRYKVAPTPVDRSALATAQEALPLVPDSTVDPCSHIQSALTLSDRDAAGEWLAFLDALGLATETDRGYRRCRRDLEAETLAAPFWDRIFGVREVLATLAASDEPVSAAAAFEAIRADVPAWERSRHDDWEAVWRDRVTVLLDWAALFDVATCTDEGYVHPVEG